MFKYGGSLILQLVFVVFTVDDHLSFHYKLLTRWLLLKDDLVLVKYATRTMNNPSPVILKTYLGLISVASLVQFVNSSLSFVTRFEKSTSTDFLFAGSERAGHFSRAVSRLRTLARRKGLASEAKACSDKRSDHWRTPLQPEVMG